MKVTMTPVTLVPVAEGWVIKAIWMDAEFTGRAESTPLFSTSTYFHLTIGVVWRTL